MKSTSIIICLALIAIVGGCVTDYKPHLDGNEENLLVVDAIISDGETVVTLQMSSDIYVAEEENNEGDNVTENAEENPSSGADFVRGATVWVESEGGERFDAADENTGRYVARTGELDPETGYRLRISLNGEEYASEYRKPQQTPPIDEVDFSLNGREIDVRIDVKGAADASKHYMWRYKGL